MGFFDKFQKDKSKDHSKEKKQSSKTEKAVNPTEVDMQHLQDVLNQMYPGIAMFVRDVNLADDVASKYIPGMIIREKAFADASCRVMGMATTHRYIILSNHMGNLAQFEHGTNWGLCVAQKDSHFKVLGQHTYKDKHAIVLLHLPDDDTWKLFKDIEISMDQQLLEMAIQRFEAKCELPPVPELATPQWLDRCAFPIGMNDNGVFWELE